MTSTSFALWIVVAAATLALAVLALSLWGAGKVLAILLVLGLAGCWAFAHVPQDDGQA